MVFLVNDVVGSIASEIRKTLNTALALELCEPWTSRTVEISLPVVIRRRRALSPKASQKQTSREISIGVSPQRNTLVVIRLSLMSHLLESLAWDVIEFRKLSD